MTLPFPIASSQTDARSPVDDNLMDSIREDLDFLDDALITSGSSAHSWNVNGPLNYLNGGIAKRLDMQFIYDAHQYAKCRAAQRVGGAGETIFDIRYHSIPNTPIIGIEAQFYDLTTSIGQISPALATQSISRATPQLSTQSITRTKAALSVYSIVNVPGTNKWRYNLSAAPDADYVVGYSVLLASCTSGANNGTFVITEVNQDGHPSIVVTNASGVAQVGVAGTLNLQLFSYNQTNPVSSYFSGMLKAASHTSALNDSVALPIHAINSGGNNIVVPNAVGVTQGAAAGTCDQYHWSFNFSSAAGADFVVGEYAHTASHTSSGNNTTALISAVNAGGNNIILYDFFMQVQAGIAGVVNTTRWKYTYVGNPGSNAAVAVGDRVIMSNHTNAANDGTFTVVEVNRTTTDNIVVANRAGVAQAFSGGYATTEKKLVKFTADQSSVYSLDSFIDIQGSPDNYYNDEGPLDGKLPFQVFEVNRGGGSNYNVVIKSLLGGLVASPAGRVVLEGRSIFSVLPELSTTAIGNAYVGPVLYSSDGADFIDPLIVPADTYIALYILSSMTDGEDLSVSLF